MATTDTDSKEINNGKSEAAGDINTNHANQNCALCGCSTPVIRCDKCASQIFCLSCDDMYHRHPKRRLHLRKAVDSIWNSHRSPHLRRHTNLPGDPSKIPIPPPRRKKRERYTISGAGLPKSAFEIPFNARESWMTREANIKSNDVVSDSFASDDSLQPSLPKQQKSSMEQRYENSEAILQQNNGIDAKAGQGVEQGQSQHDSMQSPVSPSQSLQVDTPDGRGFSSPGSMYSRGSQMSHSAADLRSGHYLTPSPQPYFYPHPQAHLIHPQMHSFVHPVPHVNCPQCLPGSWSNMMSPHMTPYHQPWSSAQSSLSRGQQEPAGDGQLRQRQNSLPDATMYPGPHMPPFPPAAFPYVGSPFYPHGYPAAPGVESPLFMDSPHGAEQQRQMLKSPSTSSSRQSHGTDRHEEISQTQVEKIAGERKIEGAEGGGGEVEQEEEAADPNAAEEEEEEIIVPEKPVEPWECVHCTFINPPGSHICQICCKTSYPAHESQKRKKKKKRPEQDAAMSADATSQQSADTEPATESMQVDSEQPMDAEKVI